MSDNFHLTLRGQKKEHLRSAVEILLSAGSFSKISHFSLKEFKPDNNDLYSKGYFSYKAAPESTYMTFYWTEDEGVENITELPSNIKDPDVLTDLIWEWLKKVDYPEGLDHDGSNEKGFFITTGNVWGHCFGSFYSVFTVAPDWQWYGK